MKVYWPAQIRMQSCLDQCFPVQSSITPRSFLYLSFQHWIIIHLHWDLTLISVCLSLRTGLGDNRSWQLTNDLWRPFPLHCVAERMACWTAWVLVKNGRKCLSQQETVNCGSNFGKVTTAFCKRKRRNFWSARTEKSDVSWIITQLLYKCYTAKWNNRLDDVKL